MSVVIVAGHSWVYQIRAEFDFACHLLAIVHSEAYSVEGYRLGGRSAWPEVAEGVEATPASGVEDAESLVGEVAEDCFSAFGPACRFDSSSSAAAAAVAAGLGLVS